MPSTKTCFGKPIGKCDPPSHVVFPLVYTTLVPYQDLQTMFTYTIKMIFALTVLTLKRITSHVYRHIE